MWSICCSSHCKQKNSQKTMSHPIFQANENSAYGGLTREEFFKKHEILHQESFMLNKKSMRIYTQSWQPDSTAPVRGVVAMIHGYTSESSWLFELTAVAIAKAGFFACALDLQGHGYSEGLPAHIPVIEPLVSDCIQFFDTVRADHPKIPTFLYGESLGGAIAILICLKQKSEWNGLILSGAMCEVSKKYKTMWPLEKLLPLAAYIAPAWKIMITKPPEKKSFKEAWKGRLVAKSPNHLPCAKPTTATALELLNVCEQVKRSSHELDLPMLILHGGDDKVCDPKAAKFVFDSAASKDKTLEIFAGMEHQLIGEPNESFELVFSTMMSWIEERTSLAKTK